MNTPSDQLDTPSVVPDDPRAGRRAARIADNRSDILDAAERVFAERGIREGSLREIARLSGFSTAAIYTYFENKQHLLAETYVRRGIELGEVIQAAAAEGPSALLRLHAIADGTVGFFERYPYFRRLLRHGVAALDYVGPSLTKYVPYQEATFEKILALIVSVVEAGQQAGEIREGDPTTLVRLYMVLVNEHVYLAAADNLETKGLTPEQFHSLIEGAMRRPFR